MSAVPIEVSDRSKLIQWLIGISIATVAWFLAYSQLSDFAEWLVGLWGLSRQTHFGEAVHFFLYDTPKVLLLLTGIVFIMGIIQSSLMTKWASSANGEYGWNKNLVGQ
ncbi:MAG: hypothetical protein U0989_05485 [Azonexus sp.]|nr:hypothetical protein [Azonexus sp.]MDZ4314201.1 hypothetical protein [Azonexus sp.]